MRRLIALVVVAGALAGAFLLTGASIDNKQRTYRIELVSLVPGSVRYRWTIAGSEVSATLASAGS